MTILLEIFTNR